MNSVPFSGDTGWGMSQWGCDYPSILSLLFLWNFLLYLKHIFFLNFLGGEQLCLEQKVVIFEKSQNLFKQQYERILQSYGRQRQEGRNEGGREGGRGNRVKEKVGVRGRTTKRKEAGREEERKINRVSLCDYNGSRMQF